MILTLPAREAHTLKSPAAIQLPLDYLGHRSRAFSTQELPIPLSCVLDVLDGDTGKRVGDHRCNPLADRVHELGGCPGSDEGKP